MVGESEDGMGVQYEIQVAEKQDLQMEVMPSVTPSLEEFSKLWQGMFTGADTWTYVWMDREWDKMFSKWLDHKTRKTGSLHTRRNYERVVNSWFDYISTIVIGENMVLKRWMIEVDHVRNWQYQLSESLSPVTVNNYLSCVSSFYSFVINEKRLLYGVELCLFTDATGRPRANPFKYGNIERSKVEGYERAEIMPDEDIGVMMRYLRDHQHTLTGARNFALILSYVSTGFRNHEVTRMQWKHIRPHRSLKNTYVYAWVGKGAKTDDVQIPKAMWNSIVHMMELDGRWVPNVAPMDQPIKPDDYIFRPLRTHMVRNLKWNNGGWKDEKHLSDKSALRIFRTVLKNAGIRNAENYRIHDLRHAHALAMLEDGAPMIEIRLKLHHSNLATTDIYLKSMKKKREDHIDDRSDRLVQKMMEF